MTEHVQAQHLRFQIAKRFNRASVKFFHAFELRVQATVEPGITVLFGHSGSGKSTLLRSIAGLAQPDKGIVVLGGKTLFDSDHAIDVPVRNRGIGMIFQSLALFPHLRADENIAYGMLDLDRASRRKKIDAAVDAFRIRHVRNHRPVHISGGEQQRVALARTLVTEPRALLLDEPMSALDPGTKSLIMDDLRAWIAERQLPVLYVTHSREEVFAMAQRVIALENGRIVGQGSPREVLGGAQHESIAEWSSLENVLRGTITSIHEAQGTMTFAAGNLELEVPLGRAKTGDQVSVGVSAHDILLAVAAPQGISARNVIQGRISELNQRDAVVSVVVGCRGTALTVYVTPASVESLALQPGREVWVVIKTHSCFLIQA
jgi:molybdate transport system ATP-binding protein